MTPNTTQASQEIMEAVENGNFRDWATFDAGLEGARFHALANILSASPFDAQAAEALLEELETFAQSYGYATADSYLTSAEGLDDDEIAATPELSILREQLFENEEEDYYLILARKTERQLAEIAVDDAAFEFLGLPRNEPNPFGTPGCVYTRMHEAMKRGRDMRAELDSPSMSC